MHLHRCWARLKSEARSKHIRGRSADHPGFIDRRKSTLSKQVPNFVELMA